MKKKLEEYENRLNTIKHNVVLKQPLASFEITKKNLENNQVKMNQFIKRYIEKKEHEMKLLANTLKLVNPLNILDKGYSLVAKDNKIIKDSDEIEIEDTIQIKLKKGELTAIVKEKKEWKI